MLISNRIELLGALREFIENRPEVLQTAIRKTLAHNGWFTDENCNLSLNAICEHFLAGEKLQKWLSEYNLSEVTQPKKIALIMAGNIPLVNFHDFLCVFVSGHESIIKLSDKDKFLLPVLIDFLKEEAARKSWDIGNVVTYTEGLVKGFDAVIATGGDNTARYFDYYFEKFPNVIRKNRTSVSVLYGDETEDDFKKLAIDIFRYFGLGCRSVSKLYVPQGYDMIPLLNVLDRYEAIMNHDKYRNNYDYNQALFLLNKIPYYVCSCLLVTEKLAFASRIACLQYEFWEDLTELTDDLKSQSERLQCIVSKKEIPGLEVTPLGETQNPSLSQYADDVDIMAFLAAL